MSGRYLLKVFWSRRKESAESCAERLYRFLDAIKTCDDVFAKWYQLGRSRKEALQKPIKTDDMAEVLSLVEKGRHRRDVGRQPIDELGFHVMIWNGGEEPAKSINLSVHCGLYSPWLAGNGVVLHFPKKLGRLADPSVAVEPLLSAVKCWDPDWCSVFSDESIRQGEFDPKAPLVDWMVFIPQIMDSVPPPSTVLRLEGVGSVVIVLPHPPRRDDPEQMKVINRIEQIIHLHNPKSGNR